MYSKESELCIYFGTIKALSAHTIERISKVKILSGQKNALSAFSPCLYNWLLKTSLAILIVLLVLPHASCQTKARASVHGVPPYSFTTPDDSFTVISIPYNAYGTLGSTKLISKNTGDTIWEYDHFMLGEIFVSDDNVIVAVNRAFYPLSTFNNIAMIKLDHGRMDTCQIQDLIDSVPKQEIDDFNWATSVFISDKKLMYRTRFNKDVRQLTNGRFTKVEIELGSFPNDVPTESFPLLYDGKSFADAFNNYSNSYRILSKNEASAHHNDTTLYLPEFNELEIYAPVLVSTSGTQSQLLRNYYVNDFKDPIISGFFVELETFLFSEAKFVINSPPKGFDRWCFGGWIAFEPK